MRAGDLREGARAIEALERRLADVVIDRAFVARKRERVAREAARAALAPPSRAAVDAQLAEAERHFARGDATAANRALDAALDLLSPIP